MKALHLVFTHVKTKPTSWTTEFTLVHNTDDIRGHVSIFTNAS